MKFLKWVANAIGAVFLLLFALDMFLFDGLVTRLCLILVELAIDVIMVVVMMILLVIFVPYLYYFELTAQHRRWPHLTKISVGMWVFGVGIAGVAEYLANSFWRIPLLATALLFISLHTAIWFVLMRRLVKETGQLPPGPPQLWEPLFPNVCP